MFGKRNTVPTQRIAYALDNTTHKARVDALDAAWRAVYTAKTDAQYADAAARLEALTNNV